jgi:hypothetical protein
MVERVVYISDWQVKAWLDKRLSLLFVPIRPQPPAGFQWDDEAKLFVPDDNGPIGIMRHGPNRGDTLLGKEAWTTAWWAGALKRSYYYQADNELLPAECTWYSPATMPREVVRIRMTVQSVSAVRMRDVAESDIRAAGIADEFPFSAFGLLWMYRYGKRYPLDTAWAWRLEVVRC